MQAMMSASKKIVILAGPNGAGKTTFAREFLLHEGDCPIFVNADLIASGLSPFRPEVTAVHEWRTKLSCDALPPAGATSSVSTSRW